MLKLYVCGALAVVVTVPLSVLGAHYMGAEYGAKQANSQCLNAMVRMSNR